MAVLGPAGRNPILRRQLGVAAATLAAAAVVATLLSDWGFLSIGGAILACQGALLTASRLRRLGPYGADEPTPPTTGEHGQLRIDAVFEHGRRAEDQLKAAIGIWLIVVGTATTGAMVFLLDRYVPWQCSG